VRPVIRLNRFWRHVLHVTEASYGHLHISQCREAPRGVAADVRASGGRLVGCLARKDAETLKLSLETWLEETRP
jgi:hypothetical protein